ncbi:reverse transcriptase [Phytophthora megakarya]|uniref:Reverse transcriptase n=1 Tax=Phytophthora megakarya TaxID=4795 RepID=A0A225W7Q5_9STRA|nr:reverse transcriptase [Phytophthora megakarya]
MVVPDSLHRDFLHHYHVSLEGGHQGVGRTSRTIQANFHWCGLYRGVQRYVGDCTDCETGKGKPTDQGESPGNIQGTYPFHVISMDHIPALRKSFKGNTELQIWVDLFTGYVIAKAGPSRETQAVVGNYEECVFRRFGASEVIRHDGEPGFMSDFFRSFNRIVKMRQSATMTYRPQGNGKAERMGQTLTRALKIRRFSWSMDGIHGRPLKQLFWWDRHAAAIAMHGDGGTTYKNINENLREVIKSRADYHNENVRPHRIGDGTQRDHVKQGYARKLAHMWHGPLRQTELISNHAARLETAGSGYRIFPIVHLSKLKPVRTFPDRPKVALNTEDDDRADFDEELMPDESWGTPLDEDEFERVHREFQDHWKGYDRPTWVAEADLNCAALLYAYERGRISRNRFNVMQSHEEGMNAE